MRRSKVMSELGKTEVSWEARPTLLRSTFNTTTFVNHKRDGMGWARIGWIMGKRW